MQLAHKSSGAEGETPSLGLCFDELFEVEDPVRVAAFLNRNPGALPLLSAAGVRLLRTFGASAVPILRPMVDPGPTPRPLLGLFVRSGELGPEDAVARYQDFIAWWVRQGSRSTRERVVLGFFPPEVRRFA